MKEKSIAEKGNQFTSCVHIIRCIIQVVHIIVYKERYIRNSSKKLKIVEKLYYIFVFY